MQMYSFPGNCYMIFFYLMDDEELNVIKNLSNAFISMFLVYVSCYLDSFVRIKS